MDKNEVVRKNIAYTGTKWRSHLRSLAPLLYTERIHYYHLYRWLAKNWEPSDQRAVLLDIGFGSGFHLRNIHAKFGIRTVGTDITPKTVEEFNARALAGCKALLMDPYTNRIPLKSKSVDVVVCSHVLEHVPDDLRLLKEIARVLKPSGMAYFNVPINEEKIPVPNHIRKYEPTRFLKLIGKAGFSPSTSFESDSFTRYVSMLGRKKGLFPLLVKRFLIAVLSLLPIPLLEKMGKVKSQFICFAILSRD
jgi:ubiquinone/menaquinone biosynthesis C-methylase UbiE